VRGEWALIEWQVVLNTFDASGNPNPDGVFRGWVNGVRHAEFTDLKIIGAGISRVFNEVKINPIFGGLGGSLSAVQTITFDHILIYKGSGQGTVAVAPTSLTAAAGVSTSATVTVLDANGNPVNGASVTVATSDPTVAVPSPASGTTNASGLFGFDIDSQGAGTCSITATATGLTSPACSVTVTSSVGPSPADWFQSTSITGLTDGQGVATWTNDADNTRNATQGTSTQQPLYRTNIINGLPALQNQGVASALNFTGQQHTAVTLFAVVDGTAIGPGNNRILRDAGFDFLLVAGGTPTTNQVQFSSLRSGTNGRFTSPAGSLVWNTGFHIVELAYDSSNVANVPTMKINGVVQAVTVAVAPAGTQVSSAGPAIIGNSDGAHALAGYIASLKRFDGVLSDADATTERTALASKFGISI
jgi:hypothetical protein